MNQLHFRGVVPPQNFHFGRGAAHLIVHNAVARHVHAHVRGRFIGRLALNFFKDGVEHRENLHIPVIVHSGDAVGLQMEGVDHVHIVQIGGGGLVGQIDRVLQGQVPDGECFKFGIAGVDATLMVMVELAEAGGHFAAAGAGGRYHDEGMAGLNVIVLSKAIIADDVDYIRGVAGNGIVPVAADAQLFQPVQKGVCRVLSAVTGQHHAAHIQPHVPENINEAEHILVIGDAQIPPHFILLNVTGVDGDDDLHIVLQLLKHPNLAVRLKARQYPGGVVIVKQLAAEFQIQLTAELMNALFDLLGLCGEILLIIEANGSHADRPFISYLKTYVYNIAQESGQGKRKNPIWGKYKFCLHSAAASRIIGRRRSRAN